jgi:hypothetical protein
MGDPLHEWLNLDSSTVYPNGYQDTPHVNSQDANAMFQYQAIPQHTKLQGQTYQVPLQPSPLPTQESFPKTANHFSRYQPPQTVQNPPFAVPSFPTTINALNISQLESAHEVAPPSNGGNLGLSNLVPQDMMDWINMAEYNAGGMSLGSENAHGADLAGTTQPSFAPDATFDSLGWPQRMSSANGIPNGTAYHAPQNQYLPQSVPHTATAQIPNHGTMLQPQAPLQPQTQQHNPAEECMKLQYWMQNGFPETPLEQSTMPRTLPTQPSRHAPDFLPNTNGTPTVPQIQQMNPTMQHFPAYEEPLGLGNAYPKDPQYSSKPTFQPQSAQLLPPPPQNPTQQECEQFLAYAMATPLGTMSAGTTQPRSDAYQQHTAVAGQLETLSICPDYQNPASGRIL